MSTATTACPYCQTPLSSGDAFCQQCGKGIADPVGPDASALASFGSEFLQEEQAASVRRAGKWLLVLSVMFVIFGTAYGVIAMNEAEEAERVLAGYDDSDRLPVNGDVYTVAELRSKIDLEVKFLFGLNYFLAIIMFGLYRWSKTSPFPAMITGLCAYLAVIVLNAIYDPKTLAQGFLIKALFIGAMITGIKAALAERDALAAQRPTP